MANYIKNDVLCEAYSHLEIDIYEDKEKLEQLKKTMISFFEERAKFLFGDDIRVELEFHEGSLKTKLTVYGSIAMIIGGLGQAATAISKYGEFRESVHYLSQDATSLAQSANLEMIFRTKAAYCDRVAIEKRKGIFGRVDELLNQVDNLKTDINNSKLPRNTKELKEFNGYTDGIVSWNDRVSTLFEKIDNEETQLCIAAGLLQELEGFPTKAPWAEELSSKSFRAEIINSDPDRAGKIEASAVRFQVTIKSIKKNFETLLKNSAPRNS